MTTSIRISQTGPAQRVAQGGFVGALVGDRYEPGASLDVVIENDDLGGVGDSTRWVEDVLPVAGATFRHVSLGETVLEGEVVFEGEPEPDGEPVDSSGPISPVIRNMLVRLRGMQLTAAEAAALADAARAGHAWAGGEN